MLRDFLKDSVIYSVGAVLSRGAALLLLPLLTRALAPSAYGAVDLLTALGALVAILVALEISQAVPRFYADAQTERERIGFASTALWFTVGMYLLVCGLAAVAAAPLSAIVLQSGAAAPLLRAALVLYFTTGIFYFVQNQLRWERRPFHYVLASAAAVGTTLALVTWLVLARGYGPAGVLLGQAGGNVVGAALALYFARDSFRFVFDTDRWARMLRFSGPLVPSGIAVFVALYSDRVVVQRFLSMHDVGVLGVGYRFASVVALLMVGFQGALTPLIFQRHRDPQTPSHLSRIFAVFWALALLLCAALAVFSRELVAIVATAQYASARVLIPLLAPAVVLASMYVFAPGLVLAKRTGRIAVLNGGGAALNLALNLALVPRVGVTGAAAATLVSATAVFIGYFVPSQRLYPIPHNWRKYVLALMAAVLVGAIGYAMEPAAAPGIVIKVLLLVSLAAALVGLRLIPPAEIGRTVSAFLVRRRGLAP